MMHWVGHTFRKLVSSIIFESLFSETNIAKEIERNLKIHKEKYLRQINNVVRTWMELQGTAKERNAWCEIVEGLC